MKNYKKLISRLKHYYQLYSIEEIDKILKEKKHQKPISRSVFSTD